MEATATPTQAAPPPRLRERYQQDVLDTAIAQYLAGELDEAGTEQAIADGWNQITDEVGKDKQLAAYVASLGVQR